MITLRRTMVAFTAIALLSVLIPQAGASHRPTRFCSESGDVCLSTRKVEGIRKLRISLAAEYFEKFRLCVNAPEGTRTCKVFEIRDTGPAFGRSVRWRRHFPNKGPGAYNVNWRQLNGDLIGRRMAFHRS